MKPILDGLKDGIKSLWSRLRDEGHEGITTPHHVHALFELSYDDLSVGILELNEGVWEFRYTPAFRDQSEVRPLVDFPDPSKVYRAHALWPFFMARIPSIAQPRVRDVIQQEGLDEHSDVQLLRRFGKRTIANPFVLETSPAGASR
jgi:HipA-like protein